MICCPTVPILVPKPVSPEAKVPCRVTDREYHPVLHRILQRLAHHSMVVDHGVGVATVLEDGLVQLPDVLGLQFLQSQSTLPEERVQPGVDEALVTLVSGTLNGGSRDIQPLPQEVRKQWGFLLWGFRFHDPGTVLLL